MLSHKKLKTTPKVDKEIIARTIKSKCNREKRIAIIAFIKAYIEWIKNNFKIMIIFFVFLYLIFARGIIIATDWMVFGDLFHNYMTFLPSWIEIGLVFQISSILSIIVFPYLCLICFKDIIIKRHETKKVFSKINTSIILSPIVITGFLLSTKILYQKFQNEDYFWTVIIIFLGELFFQLIIGFAIVMQTDPFEKFLKKSLLYITSFKNRNQ